MDEARGGSGTLFNNLIEIGHIPCLACQKTGYGLASDAFSAERKESIARKTNYSLDRYRSKDLAWPKKAVCVKTANSYSNQLGNGP